MNYDEAFHNFTKLLEVSISQGHSYIYYMIECNYEQIENHELDGTYNDYALESQSSYLKISEANM